MSTGKHINSICVAVTLAAVLLTILFMNGQALGVGLVVDADSESHSDSTYFTDNDLAADWDTSSATLITLEGDSVSISGSNAYEYDGNVVISNSGTYVVSGMLDDGYISVNANANSKVWILFQDVTISCSDNACLRVDEADKVFLTLADGTTNTLTGGSELSEEALEDGTYGVIFAHDDLTINGTGSLTIEAGYKHGIKANDDLVITGGTITIDAPSDAIHANDSFRLCNAALDLTAEDDGILVENEEEEEGYLYIESGSITVNAGGDALHANGNLAIEGGKILINSCYEGIEALTVDISGGNLTIYSTDDGINASGGSQDSFGAGAASESEQSGTASSEDSWIHISGGTITIINENGNDADGIDSNGSLLISGGTVLVSLTGGGTNNAIDVASEYGGIIEISGGTVIACGGSSMVGSVSSTSTQCSVMYNTSESMEAGTALSVATTDGEEILSWEVPCSFSSAILSSPQMSLEESYTILMGEEEESVTLEQTVTTLGEIGGMMAGGAMPDGMQSSTHNMTPPAGENTTEGTADSAEDSTTGSTADSAQVGAPQNMTPPAGEDTTEGSTDEAAEDTENNGMPDNMQNMGHPGGGMGGPQADGNAQFQPGQKFEAAQSESEENVTTVLSYDRSVYILLLASWIALVIGLVVAIRYRR